MSRTVVCYIERVAGGSLISRVRLMADGGPAMVDRSWVAPSVPGGSAGAGGAGSGSAAGGDVAAGSGEGVATGASSEAVAHARTAARWVADSLGTLGTRRLATLCIDPDGSVCTWLSAPSPDPEVIEATLMQPDADGDGGSGGGGAARLLALGASGAGGAGFSPGDASVQALATLDHPPESRGRLGKRARMSTSATRSRFAVLAVPDAPVRVFLDELDARNIEVDQVLSLWHALAMAWDPGAPGGAAEDPSGPAGERIVASVNPTAAVVAVDPIGRLVWAWSQSGQLLAGGSIRLRSIIPHAPTPAGASPAAGAELLDPDAAGARRIAVEADEPATVEFSHSDAGRLVLDWLSWSAQLGHCPQRVACIGPAPVPGAAAPTDAGLIGRSIGELWPGASIGVAVHVDPIGATMQRLLTRDIAISNRAAADLPAADVERAGVGRVGGTDDPRGALVGLSARAGRVDRRMYTWKAVGVAAIAAVVGILGWQLHRAAGQGDAAIQAAADARKEAINSLLESIPALAASSNFKVDLESEKTRLQQQLAALKPPRPLLQEMEKVLNVIADHQNVRVERFSINQANAIATLVVPDADTGPNIVEKLQKMPNLYMYWTGSVNVNFGAAAGGERRYTLNGNQADAARATGGGR